MATELVLAGRADCTRLVEAEQLLDYLAGNLPSLHVKKTLIPPAEWEAHVVALCHAYGFPQHSVAEPLIWTGTGRYIGTVDDLSAWTQQYYGMSAPRFHGTPDLAQKAHQNQQLLQRRQDEQRQGREKARVNAEAAAARAAADAEETVTVAVQGVEPVLKTAARAARRERGRVAVARRHLREARKRSEKAVQDYERALAERAEAETAAAAAAEAKAEVEAAAAAASAAAAAVESTPRSARSRKSRRSTSDDSGALTPGSRRSRDTDASRATDGSSSVRDSELDEEVDEDAGNTGDPVSAGDSKKEPSLPPVPTDPTLMCAELARQCRTRVRAAVASVRLDQLAESCVEAVKQQERLITALPMLSNNAQASVQQSQDRAMARLNAVSASFQQADAFLQSVQRVLQPQEGTGDASASAETVATVEPEGLAELENQVDQLWNCFDVIVQQARIVQS